MEISNFSEQCYQIVHVSETREFYDEMCTMLMWDHYYTWTLDLLLGFETFNLSLTPHKNPANTRGSGINKKRVYMSFYCYWHMRNFVEINTLVFPKLMQKIYMWTVFFNISSVFKFSLGDKRRWNWEVFFVNINSFVVTYRHKKHTLTPYRYTCYAIYTYGFTYTRRKIKVLYITQVKYMHCYM